MTYTTFKPITLRQFAKLLPGIDHSSFLAKFADPYGLFLDDTQPGLNFRESVRIKGRALRRDEMLGVALSKRVDAAAAKAFQRLYTAGALPMTKGKTPDQALELETYVQDAIAAEACAEQRKQEAAEEAKAARAAREAKIADPSIIQESEFTLSLLNDIFFRHLGAGGGMLAIGGLQVTKTEPQRHVSNSGKSFDWSYTFLWTSPDGSPRRLSRESEHAGNRRSDPDRNWGLGRE